MNTPETSERRVNPRIVVTKPCKVMHVATRKYLPAQTCDISSGGALLRITTPRPLAPGDEIQVFIAWDHRNLLTTGEQVRAHVMRTYFDGVEQIIGVRFAQSDVVLGSAAA